MMKKSKPTPRDELLSYIDSEQRFPFRKPAYIVFLLAVELAAFTVIWSITNKYTGRDNGNSSVLVKDIQVMIAAAVVLIIYVLAVNIVSGKYSSRRRRNRDMIGEYGEQSVVTDWLSSREISPELRLGNRFLFVSGQSMIWLTNIMEMEKVQLPAGDGLRLTVVRDGKTRVCDVAAGKPEDCISLITERRESARSRGH